MAEYTVTWSIDITADTPIEAAKEARLAQQDPFSEALYFEVYPMDNNEVVDAVDLLLDTE